MLTITSLFANGADMDTGHWVLVAILGGAGLFLVAWLNNAKRNQEEIGILHGRVNELTTRVFGLQDESASCKQREADLKMELSATNVQVRLLQMKTGTALPSPIPGVVVADLKGIIRIFSPSLVPMLGWLPKEVEGQRIETVIPPETVGQHRAAFGRFAAAGGLPAVDREIITYALAKSGARVPVVVHLKSLQPEGLITAEIRQRASADGK